MTSPAPEPATWSRLLRGPGAIALLAAAYFITGRLGLLLALPPGYATAVWPPSGIALAGILLLGYRAWPGVVLGSFAVNVITSLKTTDIGALVTSSWPAAVIGLGAAAQAVVGALLVRRFTGFPRPFEREKEIGAFLVLGGLTSCLIGATVGTGTLLTVGLLEPAELWTSWWTWWSGDSIGVFIFTPLVLVWTSRTRETNIVRQLSVSVPSVLGFAVVVTLFIYSQRAEQERVDIEFGRQTDRHVQALKTAWDGYTEVLHSVVDFFASTGARDGAQFGAFVEPILRRRPGLIAVSWNERVTAGGRAAYEERLRAAGAPAGEITERNAAGRLGRAGSRPEHIVVTYIEPSAPNAAVVGFDVASDPLRLAALRRARASGEPTATEPINLIQTPNDPRGFLVFLPMYAGGSAGDAREVLGYVTAAFQIDHLISSAVQGADSNQVLLRIYDETEAAPLRYLYENRRLSGQAGGGDPWAEAVVLRRSATLDIAGRRWRLEFGLEKKDLLSRTHKAAWGLLTGGLLFVGMLQALLLLVTGRSAAIEALVAERTENLSRANERLASEVTERTQAEEAAKQLEMQLVRQNEELEEKNRRLEEATRLKSEFLANMSHELRTPLNAIIGFGQLLRDGRLGPVSSRQERHLDDILSSAEHLLRLINDVLDLAKVEAGRIEVRPARVDVAAAIGEAAAVLRPLSARKRIELAMDVDPSVGTVVVDPDKLQQVLYNYLSNAIKFTPAGGSVRVRVTASGDMFRLAVEDTGPGIDEKDIARLFVEFQQLDAASGKPHEGTGLGLALTKRIVEAQGGSVGVRSAPGSGSVFYAELPRVVEGGREGRSSVPPRPSSE